MSETAPSGGVRKRILCLLRDGPTEEARRWAEALAAAHEVDTVDLTRPDLACDELLDRIFVADRVISW